MEKKLKTLKEIDGWDEHHGAVSRLELRKEAIKWIKESRRRKSLTSKGGELSWEITEESWMDFFNIQESDLK